jgi:HAD superfamily hydrolase (TIGR01450 family)
MSLLASREPLATAHDLALVDLDGVVYRGPKAIPYAAESLDTARALGLGIAFITNNASREPQTVADHLAELGIAAVPDEVMTSAQAAAALLADGLAPRSRVLVVGGPGLVTAVRGAGFTVVTSADDAPDAVVQGFSPDVSWRELAEAAYAIQHGARYVATNRDMTLPNDRGLAPGNGSLVAAVVAATGVEPLSAGKPEPTMYRLAVQGRGSERPLVVGDRLDTDLGGARAAGYPGLHVLTGVSSARDAVLAQPDHRPDYIGLDLRSLLEAHAAPDHRDGWWVCGSAAARVADGALELRAASPRDDAGLTDLIRVACSAAWAAEDAGVHVDPATVPELGPGAT